MKKVNIIQTLINLLKSGFKVAIEKETAENKFNIVLFLNDKIEKTSDGSSVAEAIKAISKDENLIVDEADDLPILTTLTILLVELNKSNKLSLMLYLNKDGFNVCALDTMGMNVLWIVSGETLTTALNKAISKI